MLMPSDWRDWCSWVLFVGPLVFDDDLLFPSGEADKAE